MANKPPERAAGKNFFLLFIRSISAIELIAGFLVPADRSCTFAAIKETKSNATRARFSLVFVGNSSVNLSCEERRYVARGHPDPQMVADKIPVLMKLMTFARERLLNRAKPQIPCPVVQPFPSYIGGNTFLFVIVKIKRYLKRKWQLAN